MWNDSEEMQPFEEQTIYTVIQHAGLLALLVIALGVLVVCTVLAVIR